MRGQNVKIAHSKPADVAIFLLNCWLRLRFAVFALLQTPDRRSASRRQVAAESFSFSQANLLLLDGDVQGGERAAIAM